MLPDSARSALASPRLSRAEQQHQQVPAADLENMEPDSGICLFVGVEIVEIVSPLDAVDVAAVVGVLGGVVI
jgi:hypothetical protein